MGKAGYYMIEDLSPFASVAEAQKRIDYLRTLPQENEQVQRAMKQAQKILAAAQAGTR